MILNILTVKKSFMYILFHLQFNFKYIQIIVHAIIYYIIQIVLYILHTIKFCISIFCNLFL